MKMPDLDSSSLDFIRERVAEDVKANKYGGRVHTRFPPEPNGYLHVGHAKSITINFGLAEEFGGKCNLRFDDTNPAKEETEYVELVRNSKAFVCDLNSDQVRQTRGTLTEAGQNSPYRDRSIEENLDLFTRMK